MLELYAATPVLHVRAEALIGKRGAHRPTGHPAQWRMDDRYRDALRKAQPPIWRVTLVTGVLVAGCGAVAYSGVAPAHSGRPVALPESVFVPVPLDQPAVVERLAPAPPVQRRAELPVTLPRPVSGPEPVRVVWTRPLPEPEPARVVRERKRVDPIDRSTDGIDESTREPRREDKDRDRPRWKDRDKDEDEDRDKGRGWKPRKERERGGGEVDRDDDRGRDRDGDRKDRGGDVRERREDGDRGRGDGRERRDDGNGRGDDGGRTRGGND